MTVLKGDAPTHPTVLGAHVVQQLAAPAAGAVDSAGQMDSLETIQPWPPSHHEGYHVETPAWTSI